MLFLSNFAHVNRFNIFRNINKVSILKLYNMSDELKDSNIVESQKSEIKCEPADIGSNNSETNIIQEGQAKILVTPSKNVFYNPVQEFNRDLSICVLNTYSNLFYESISKQDIFKSLTFGEKNEDGLNVLEALSATGLRSIRYAKEVKGINNIIANDISSLAYTNIQKNIEHNEIKELVTAHNQDATHYMYLNKHNFHVIDLDPYGCPTKFLESAVQCAKDKGLLMVTCTDMAVLAGNTPETCRTKYGAISLKHRACHELAIRIALQAIESHANRFGRYIKPLLSISADFYIRLFLTIHTSAKECKESASKLAYVHSCVGCETTTLQPLVDTIKTKTGLKYVPTKGSPVGAKCTYCDSRHQMAGPIWAEPIHDKTFVEKMYDSLNSEPIYPYNTIRRIQGTLEMILEEIDVPLYYTLPKLSSILHCTSPSLLQVRSAILHLGYKVSLSHCCPTSIKTNAPPDVIWAIMQAWTLQYPPSSKRIVGQAAIILGKTYDYQINFDIHPDANPSSRKTGLTRFQKNPAPYWGPGTRHKTGGQENEKSRKKQGKKRVNSPSSLNPSKKLAHSSPQELT